MEKEKADEAKTQGIRQAKIQATLKIIEWSRDDIEPGIDGNPSEKHLALSAAFQQTYKMISETIDGDSADADDK